MCIYLKDQGSFLVLTVPKFDRSVKHPKKQLVSFLFKYHARLSKQDHYGDSIYLQGRMAEKSNGKS